MLLENFRNNFGYFRNFPKYCWKFFKELFLELAQTFLKRMDGNFMITSDKFRRNL